MSAVMPFSVFPLSLCGLFYPKIITPRYECCLPRINSNPLTPRCMQSHFSIILKCIIMT